MKKEMPNKRKEGFGTLGRVFLFLLMIVGMLSMAHQTKAASALTVTEIDYDAQTLTVKSTSSDTLLYFSDSKQKTWEVAYGVWTEGSFTMDISFVSDTKNYILSLKGNVSSTPITVKLPARKTNFSASINTLTSSVSFSSNATVEWRKAVTGYNATQWRTYDQVSFAKEFETLALKGATLYFRTAQVKGTSADSVGARPSKEVKVGVSKRAAAPSASLDGSALQIKGKTTMEYRKNSSSDWISFSTDNLSLATIAPETLLESAGENVTDASIDVRTKQTSSKVASQTKTIEIPAQVETPENYEFTYISQTKCGLKLTSVDQKNKTSIAAPSSSNPYEYTIVKSGATLDYSSAKWTAITSMNQVTITSTQAPEGSTLYYRKKANSSDNLLATKPQKIQISAYPASSTVTGASASFTKIQGVDKTMVFSLRTPADNSVSSITFNGSAAEFTTTVVKDTKTLNSAYYQTITVTITSVEKVEKSTSNINKELIAEITLSSGEVISSGVSLTIVPKTVLAGDSDTSLYSWLELDKNQYDVDTKNSFKLYTENTTGNDAGVASVTVGSYTLTSSSYSGLDSNGYQTITISDNDVKALGDYLNSNSAYDVIVKLKNGEKLTGLVTYTVKSVASVTSSSSGFGFAKNTYQEYNAASGTGIKNPSVTLKINTEANSLIDGLYFDSVTWGPADATKRIDILDGLETSQLTTTVTLNLKTVKESELKGSYPVYFTYKDRKGKTYTISKGYTLTCS